MTDLKKERWPSILFTGKGTTKAHELLEEEGGRGGTIQREGVMKGFSRDQRDAWLINLGFPA